MTKVKIPPEELELAAEIGALKMGTFQILSRDKNEVILEMEKNEAHEARQRCLDAVLEIGLGGEPPSSYVSPFGEKIESLSDAFFIAIKGR